MPEFIEGHGAVFFNADEPGTEFRLWEYTDDKGETIEVVERIDEGAFDAALARPDNVRGLYNHNPDHLLGTTSAGTMELDTDERGLRYVIPYDEKDPDHQRVASKMERGDLVGSSFAFTIDAEEWTRADGKDVRIITDLTLYDVGPVTYPAYESSESGARSTQRRFVSLDGKPMEVRSSCIGDARASHAGWLLSLETRTVTTTVEPPSELTVTGIPDGELTVTIDAETTRKIQDIETLERRVRLHTI